MRQIALLLSMVGLLVIAAGCATYDSETAPDVVDDVDLERYTGTWYELTSVPIRPQRGCVGTTARYELRDDGDIDVINTCYDESFDGDIRRATGRAWLQDDGSDGRLWVRFFWPFRSHYWIIDLDEDYRWAVISGPDRDTLWVLSRSPCMEQHRFEEIVDGLQARNFDVQSMETTPQRGGNGDRCEVELRE